MMNEYVEPHWTATVYSLSESVAALAQAAQMMASADASVDKITHAAQKLAEIAEAFAKEHTSVK